MSPPEEVKTAIAHQRVFELRVGASIAFMVAMFLVGFMVEDALSKQALLAFMGAGGIPLLVTLFVGQRRGILADLEIASAWSQREAERLVTPATDDDPVGADARWEQIVPLISRLRELLGAGDGQIVDHAEAHLRRVLVDLRLLEGALAVEQAFADDARRRRLAEALADAEAEWSRALGLLRDLHVALSTRERRGDALAALDELAQLAVAQDEVEAVSTSDLRQRAQRARQRE